MAAVAPEPMPEPERWDLGQRPVSGTKSDWPKPYTPPLDRDADRASDPFHTRLPDFSNVVQRPTWHARAACRGMATAVFFSEVGDATEARAVCGSCPVAAPCSAQAHRQNEWGTWAGLTRRQRQTVRSLLRQEDAS